jgi:hypothetical protein
MQWTRKIKKVTAVILMLTASLVCNSCFTLNYSSKGASIPPEAKTFTVQYFENQARNQEAGLAQTVTDNLKDYIQSNSRLTLITNGIGDVDFEGAITGYEVRPAAIVSGDEAALPSLEETFEEYDEETEQYEKR